MHERPTGAPGTGSTCATDAGQETTVAKRYEYGGSAEEKGPCRRSLALPRVRSSGSVTWKPMQVMVSTVGAIKLRRVRMSEVYTPGACVLAFVSSPPLSGKVDMKRWCSSQMWLDRLGLRWQCDSRSMKKFFHFRPNPWVTLYQSCSIRVLCTLL